MEFIASLSSVAETRGAAIIECIINSKLATRYTCLCLFISKPEISHRDPYITNEIMHTRKHDIALCS